MNAEHQQPADGAGAYIYDPSNDFVAAEILDAGYSAGLDWPDVVDELRKAASERGVDPQSPLGLQLIRVTLLELEHAAPGRAGCRLGPRWDSGDRAYPARIQDANEHVLELWRTCARLCQAPGAVARTNDLLWERRDGHAAEHARRAADAYLRAVADRQVDVATALYLVRAWDLGCRISDWSVVLTAEHALLDAVERALTAGEYLPGSVLPMLEALGNPPTRARLRNGPPPPASQHLERLLDGAFTAYRGEDVLEELAVLMRRLTADNAMRDAIDRRLVAALLEEAQARSGLARQHALLHVIDVARRRGVVDLADEATRLLQRLRPGDLDLKRNEVTAVFPRDHLERNLRWATEGRTWQHGLGFFMMSAPPTGSLDQLREAAAAHAAKGYLHRLFPVQKLTREGMPLLRVEPGDEAADLAFQAQFAAYGYGSVLAEGLRRLGTRYGTPKSEELFQFLCDMGGAEPTLVEALTEAFLLYWAGSYDAAAHLIVPKVEAALRLILRECDIAIYRTQVGPSQGEYPGLYELITAMEEIGFDPDWAYYLRWLLTGPHGRNLRNDIAHGLIHGVSHVDAALALRAASLVILLAGPNPALDWDDELDGRPIQTGRPTGATRDRSHMSWLLRHPAPPHRQAPARRTARSRASVLLAGVERIRTVVLRPRASHIGASSHT